MSKIREAWKCGKMHFHVQNSNADSKRQNVRYGNELVEENGEEVFALASSSGVRLLAVQAAARSLEDAFLEALTGEAD